MHSNQIQKTFLASSPGVMPGTDTICIFAKALTPFIVKLSVKRA